jgi:replicative DNA helicase
MPKPDLINRLQSGELATDPATSATPIESGAKLATPIADVLRKGFARMTRRANKQEKPIETPWPKLNTALAGGLWRSGLYTLVSGTGTGKTQFAMQIVEHAARTEPDDTVYIALELGAVDISARLLGLASKRKWSTYYRGESAAELNDAIGRHQKELEDLKLFVEQANPYEWRAEERLRQLVELHRPGLIVLDFLQLVSDDTGDARRAIGRAAYAGRQIARSNDTAVLLLSTTARANYGAARAGTDGNKHELGKGDPSRFLGFGKESGEIESACDGEMFLGLGPYDKDEPERDAYIAVGKVRAGQPDWVELKFDGGHFFDPETSGYQTFEEESAGR